MTLCDLGHPICSGQALRTCHFKLHAVATTFISDSVVIGCDDDPGWWNHLAHLFIAPSQD
jgi:hypothetical protein